MSTVTCPYCNHIAPLPRDAFVGRRLTCARCGESFAYRGPVEDGGPSSPPPPADRATDSAPPPRGFADIWAEHWAEFLDFWRRGGRRTAYRITVAGVPGSFIWLVAVVLLLVMFIPGVMVEFLGERMRSWPKATVALLVVGFMAVMATGTVAFALWTQPFRRGNDPPPPQVDEASSRVVAPRDLPVLGYLPRGTNAVVGLHVGEAMQEAAGREFLTRFKPSDVLPLPAKAAEKISPGKLAESLGPTLDEINFVAVGATDAGDQLPRVTVVVQTRQNCDQAKIKTALKAKPVSRPSRELFEVTLDDALFGTLWFADPKTFVIGVLAANLDDIPEKPFQGLGHLSPEVRAVLENQLGPSAQAWVIASSPDWTKTVTGKLLAPKLPETNHATLEKVRAIGLRLTFAKELTFAGYVGCADSDAANQLKGLLLPAEGDRKPIPVLGNRAELAPVARQLGESLKVEQSGSSLLFQARASAEIVANALAPRP